MWEVARRPRQLGVLLVCLAIATGFALLAQWQVSRSVDEGQVIVRETETAVPLPSIAEPQAPVTSIAAAQLVTVTGTIVPGDFVVLSGRINGGVEGYWVVAHLVEGGAEVDAGGNSGGDAAAGGPSLAVALGWAATPDAAASAIARLEATATEGPQLYTGRFLVSESPQEDDFENGEQNSVSVAALINQWDLEPNGVYGGYLVSATASAGLERLDSPAPSTEVILNWLNVFYAVEWVVFAGFAVFLWFRMVRDEWQREQEDAQEALDDFARAGAQAPPN